MSHNSPAQLPLATDLDGSLLRTDTLWEGLCRLLAANPLYFFALPFWLQAGRLALKWRLVNHSLAGAEHYPLSPSVLHFLKTEAKAGRPIYLATASPKPIAEATAKRLGFITDVFASSDACNLKGQVKADLLVARFGHKGFDYIGDSPVDAPVWKAARTAIVTGGDPKAINCAQAVNQSCQILPAGRPALRDWAKAMRVHQWAKNLLVFVPMFMAHDFSWSAFTVSLSAFFSLSCCASFIYIINDCCDLTNDRQHPIKKNRPFASGQLSLCHAPALLAATLFMSGMMAISLPAGFIYCLVAYLLGTLLYSFYAKRTLFFDVILLAGLYVLRIMAGAAACETGLSNWLLAFMSFFFLGLALIKRAGALRLLSPKTNLPGRAYIAEDLHILESMAISSGFAAFVIVALYIDSLQAMQLYARPAFLWGVCPLFIYWYGRIAILAHRGKLDDDPVNFAISDKSSYIIAILLSIIIFLAI